MDKESRILVRKPEGNRPLGRSRRRRDNIKIVLKEIGCSDREWIDLSRDREQWRDLLNTVMNLGVP
jgi:hypothetical protein